MRVSEIEAGTRVFVEAIRGEHMENWETHVYQIQYKQDLIVLQKLKEKYQGFDFCFLEPIYVEGKLVDFSSKEFVKNLVIIKEASPYAWQKVAVFNMSLPKAGRVHVVASARQELPHNRRGSFRIRILQPGELAIIDTEIVRSVVVNDISATGVGLMVKNMANIQVGSRINISFFDEGRFYLNATVRRIKQLAVDRYIVGCEFDRQSESVAQYVNLKQLKMRRELNDKK